MAYDRETDVVLTGSLNLLPAGDLIPPEDAIALQGWRVDKAGALESRLDQLVLRDFGASVHTLFLDLTTPKRYFGVTTSLYREGTLAAIETGFDGKPLGMASMWGALYVMNRAKKGRDHPGTGWAAWGMAAPGALTLGGALPAPPYWPFWEDPLTAGGSLPIGVHEYRMTYQAGGVEGPAGPATYPGADETLRTALLWAESADVPGGYGITGWNIYRDGFKLNVAPLAFSNFPAPPTYFTDDGTAVPGVPLAPGGLVPGVPYTYYATQVNTWGEESNPSVPLVVTPDSRGVADLVGPAAMDATIVSWNVYRTGNTLQAAYRVNPAPIAIAGLTFTDDGLEASGMNDVEVTRLGIELETDNDAPPDCAGLAGPYYERLLAFNSAAHPNWLWWSKQGKPYAFPGAALDEGNHTPVGDDGEEIVQVTLHPQHARVYKTRSIWRCAGDPDTDNSTLEKTNSETGLTGKKAITTAGDIDYFEGPEGIYAHNGYGSPKKLSHKLDPLFKGDPIRLSGARPSAPLNLAARADNVLAVRNGRLYFSYAAGLSSTPSATLICDLETGRWSSDERAFTALYDEGQGGSLAAASGGTAYLLEKVQLGPVPLIYQTGYRDQTKRDRQKTYADVVIEYSVARGGAADAGLDVTAYYNYGSSSELLGTILYQTIAGGVTRERAVLPCGAGDAGQMARNLSIRIAGSAVCPVTIYSVELHYFLEARDALTFDSDETHLGYQGPKEIDLLEFDIAASGDWTWTLFTDRPGGAMAARAWATKHSTTGRQSIQIPCETTEGRLVRILITAAATFRLYGVSVRSRHLGVLIDGTNGEIFSILEQRAA